MPIVSSQRENSNSKKMKDLPRQQKIGVVSLAILTISIVIIWALQINSQLNKPFLPGGPKSAKLATTTDISLRDSDGDGISDADEINIYRTSPYLEDSDGDGISDKQEISQGTDPNCPSGTDCGSTKNPLNTEIVASSSLDAFGETLPLGSDATSVPSDMNEITPAILRDTLLKNGYDKATLDTISDADLMYSYQEALKQNEANTANSATATSTIVNQ